MEAVSSRFLAGLSSLGYLKLVILCGKSCGKDLVVFIVQMSLRFRRDSICIFVVIIIQKS